MFEEEIASQENLVLSSQNEVIFYQMLLHEAAIIAARGERDEDESFKSYVSTVYSKLEAAENNLFDDMAELWLLRSNNYALNE